jgi:3-deoxy-manno-octulosonate cytidylyltransferase (CMP-KDO synthetase)
MFDGERIVDRIIKIVKQIDLIDDIIIATDDEDLGKELVEIHDIEGYHVSEACCATHRAFNFFKDGYCIESERKVTLPTYDYYITIPADEPAIDPVEVNKILKESNLSDGEILTFFTRFFCEQDLFSPLSCKIVQGQDYMVYNSRAVVPVTKDGKFRPLEEYLKHVGIFVIPKDIFERFGNLWDYTVDIESLEQNRFLQAGIDIRLSEVKHIGFGIDVPEQIKELEERVQSSRPPEPEHPLPERYELCYRRVNPKIICIFVSTDGGKSLFRQVFMENFKTQIYDNTRADADSNIHQVITKTTTKSNMLIMMQAGWFKNYGDYGINLVRDIRARWSVTQHRNSSVHGGIDLYANEMHKLFRDFKAVEKQTPERMDKILTIRFEDYIQDAEYWFEILTNFCNLKLEHEYYPQSFRYNEWFSDVDLRNIHLYIHGLEREVKQSELDYLSEEFKEYNERFGYPEHLKVEDIFPETIYDDIQEYIEIWQNMDQRAEAAVARLQREDLARNRRILSAGKRW